MHEYRHYSSSAVTLDLARTYVQEISFKPTGFWISVLGDDDWPSWCRAEELNVEALEVEHAVTLRPEATILFISSGDELVAFHAEYGANPSYWPTRADQPDRLIDWPRLASLYDGIVIAPYLYGHRLFGPFWYSSWDVASGCIWNLSALESLHVLEREA